MDYAEANQRNFMEYWMQLMVTDPAPHSGNGKVPDAAAAEALTRAEA
jgi:hypothetical protein